MVGGVDAQLESLVLVMEAVRNRKKRNTRHISSSMSGIYDDMIIEISTGHGLKPPSSCSRTSSGPDLRTPSPPQYVSCSSRKTEKEILISFDFDRLGDEMVALQPASNVNVIEICRAVIACKFQR